MLRIIIRCPARTSYFNCVHLLFFSNLCGSLNISSTVLLPSSLFLIPLDPNTTYLPKLILTHLYFLMSGIVPLFLFSRFLYVCTFIPNWISYLQSSLFQSATELSSSEVQLRPYCSLAPYSSWFLNLSSEHHVIWPQTTSPT